MANNEQKASEAESFTDMVSHGILDASHRPIAEKIFGEKDFVAFVLRAHLLLEKGLNARLREKGVPEVLLTGGGLTFHQKYRAYNELYFRDANRKTVFEVFNTLRNNLAHDFWDPAECVRNAMKRVYAKKAQHDFVEECAGEPLDSMQGLFYFLAVMLGIYVAKKGLPWDPEMTTLQS